MRGTEEGELREYTTRGGLTLVPRVHRPSAFPCRSAWDSCRAPTLVERPLKGYAVGDLPPGLEPP
jgi:hypothetical protein